MNADRFLTDAQPVATPVLGAPKVWFLAPAGREVGLTSMALGLVQALQRDRIKVGFAKPITQPGDHGGLADLSTHFADTLLHVSPPDSIPFTVAATRLAQDQTDTLMEEVVALVEAAGQGCDAVVVEGLNPDAAFQVAARLNALMARSLSATLLPVLSGADIAAGATGSSLDLLLSQYGEGADHPPAVAGLLINRVADRAEAEALRGSLAAGPGGTLVPVLSAVPFEQKLRAPRLSDVVSALGLGIASEGNLAQIRVQEILIAGRGVEGVIDRLKPDTLVVAAGERSDIVLAVGLAHLRGMPLAGLLLTCGTRLSPQVEALLRPSMLEGLPILLTTEDTFAIGSRLAGLDRYVRGDDAERMQTVIDFISAQVDTTPLRADGTVAARRDRMPPPAFRHALVQSARRADKRIVLPEGDEPRTLRAAAICHEKGIARCVLLGDPQRIRMVAEAQAINLPAGLEIVDPATLIETYVPPMVELRRAKGLTAMQARAQLADTVVLGTMMLATGDVDGLVSGAVHTTANTIRPALQLIKTAPGAGIVSSVFFMLMPDQVLVYGDCAVNPDPTAEELADIALQSADSAKAFGLEPRVAMISYSTGSSGAGDDVEKVRQALEIAKARRPDLLIDGPMQYDAASVESVGQQKAPGSPVAGRANVFVFPDLNTGNTTYKAVQRSARVNSVGPMLQGLRKPVNDLSRGALVDDIVYTIALTAIQAGQAETPAG